MQLFNNGDPVKKLQTDNLQLNFSISGYLKKKNQTKKLNYLEHKFTRVAGSPSAAEKLLPFRRYWPHWKHCVLHQNKMVRLCLVLVRIGIKHKGARYCRKQASELIVLHRCLKKIYLYGNHKDNLIRLQCLSENKCNTTLYCLLSFPCNAMVTSLIWVERTFLGNSF